MTLLPKRDGQLGNGKNGMMESPEIYRNRTILGSFEDKMDVSDSTMKVRNDGEGCQMVLD